MIPQPQSTDGASVRQRRRLANGGLAAAFALCFALTRFPPTEYGFYPLCPIHQYLGLECPGCGATRALAALLHGQFAEALRSNALFVLLLPFALIGVAELYRRAMRAERFRWPQLPVPAVYATLTAAAIFTVARNLL